MSKWTLEAKAVGPLLGEVYLLEPLDYEQQRLYRLTVLVTDYSQDQDPTCHRSGSCTITIEVEVLSPEALERVHISLWHSDFPLCASLFFIVWLEVGGASCGKLWNLFPDT